MAQVWLITGSARGLGRAIAEAVLAAGDKLIATARHPQQLSDLVERYGENVRAVALDVTEEGAAIAAVQLAVDVFGRLDVLVNNAGYGNLAAIEDTTMQDFRAQLETNLFGVVNLTKAAIPVMRRQGTGRILQFSSVGGRVGPIGRGAYAAAKWGVEGFSEVLAKEVGPLGIKVTIIEPGGFRTDFAGSSQTILADNPAYASTVGAVAKFQREYDGAQPGDPKKEVAVVERVHGFHRRRRTDFQSCLAVILDRRSRRSEIQNVAHYRRVERARLCPRRVRAAARQSRRPGSAIDEQHERSRRAAST